MNQRFKTIIFFLTIGVLASILPIQSFGQSQDWQTFPVAGAPNLAWYGLDASTLSDNSNKLWVMEVTQYPAEEDCKNGILNSKDPQVKCVQDKEGGALKHFFELKAENMRYFFYQEQGRYPKIAYAYTYDQVSKKYNISNSEEEKDGLQGYADAITYYFKKNKLAYKSFLVSPNGNLVNEALAPTPSYIVQIADKIQPNSSAVGSIQTTAKPAAQSMDSQASAQQSDTVTTDLQQASNALSDIGQQKQKVPQQNWSGIIIWGFIIWGWYLYSENQKKRQAEKDKGKRESSDAEQRERERQAKEFRERERQEREQEERSRHNERERRDRGTTHREETNRTPYEILGISPYATAEEIRRAYKKKALENHPDRTAGLGEEYRQLAEKRMKEINVAYQKLRNEK